MDLKALLEKRASLKTQMAELLETAKNETRTMNEDEIKKFDELETEIRGLDATIERIEKANKIESREIQDEDLTVEERESKLFVDYIRATLENRENVNMTTGDNGVIIPVTIAQKIITKAYEMSNLLAKATKYNTKGKVTIPVYDDSSNKINMAYADEFTELEASIGKFKSVELGNYLAGALALISKSLVANTDIDLETVVINLMAQAIARFMEKECLYGTDNKVAGLRGVTQTITTATAVAITADELIKLKNQIKKGFRTNANWIMSNETLTAIELLKDNNGKFMFREDMTGEYSGYLLGYPVEVSDNMQEIGAGKTVIYFGDYSGLALKQRDDALELQVLREKYATQHAIGVNSWIEFDAKVEDTQKIAKLVMASA